MSAILFEIFVEETNVELYGYFVILLFPYHFGKVFDILSRKEQHFILSAVGY